MDSSIADRAKKLTELHAGQRPLVLPTVWDAWSARVTERSGFAALTVGSHPVAEALGLPDNEGMSIDQALEAVARVTAAVDIPVSADMESGYGVPPAELVERLLAAGAVGLNLEDTVHSEGKRLRSSSEHADLIAAVRQAADEAGVPLAINARTDLFMRAEGEIAPLLDEGISRLQACVDAGATSVYPVKVRDDESIKILVEALSVPVNITCLPDKDELAHFAALGVGRISFGPLLQSALAGSLEGLLTPWK